jgi:predicted dehydrogenase
LEDAALAFQNDLDVLLEKPMAVDAKQAHKLCELAVKTGRKLYVGCDLRFSESLNNYRDQLALLGKIHSVRIEAMSYLPDWRPNRPYHETYSARADEGGVLRDLIHEIDYAGWIFGWPNSCQATIKNLGRLGIASEEIVEINWETNNGCLVSIGLDYLTKPPRRRITAHGETGTAEWDAFAGTVAMTVDGLPGNTTTIVNEPDHTTIGLDQAFIDACNGNVDNRLADGSDGYKALALSDAARRSTDSRMTEKIEYK